MFHPRDAPYTLTVVVTYPLHAPKCADKSLPATTGCGGAAKTKLRPDSAACGEYAALWGRRNSLAKRQTQAVFQHGAVQANDTLASAAFSGWQNSWIRGLSHAPLGGTSALAKTLSVRGR